MMVVGWAGLGGDASSVVVVHGVLEVDGVPVGAPCLCGVRGCGVGGRWGAGGSRRTLRTRLESGRGGGCGVGRDDVALESALI
jgi:hypothetical protein